MPITGGFEIGCGYAGRILEDVAADGCGTNPGIAEGTPAGTEAGNVWTGSVCGACRSNTSAGLIMAIWAGGGGAKVAADEGGAKMGVTVLSMYGALPEEALR